MFLGLILAVGAAGNIHGQPVPPREPMVVEPVLRPVSVRTQQPPPSSSGPELLCRLVFAGGTTNTGLLLPGKETLTVTTLQGRTELRWTSVRQVVVRRWEGREVRPGEWRFTPAETEVTLKDNGILFAVGEIPELLQPLFRDRRGVRRVYSVFFDRRRSGRWVVTGGKAPQHPERHPAKGCLIRLEVFPAPGGQDRP